jgi:hypothetical protein
VTLILRYTVGVYGLPQILANMEVPNEMSYVKGLSTCRCQMSVNSSIIKNVLVGFCHCTETRMAFPRQFSSALSCGLYDGEPLDLKPISKILLILVSRKLFQFTRFWLFVSKMYLHAPCYTKGSKIGVWMGLNTACLKSLHRFTETTQSK